MKRIDSHMRFLTSWVLIDSENHIKLEKSVNELPKVDKIEQIFEKSYGPVEKFWMSKAISRRPLFRWLIWEKLLRSPTYERELLLKSFTFFVKKMFWCRNQYKNCIGTYIGIYIVNYMERRERSFHVRGTKQSCVLTKMFDWTQLSLVLA